MKLANTFKGLQEQFESWVYSAKKSMGGNWGGCPHSTSLSEGVLQISLWNCEYIKTNGDDIFIPSIKISITDDEITICEQDEIYTATEALTALDAVKRALNKGVA